MAVRRDFSQRYVLHFLRKLPSVRGLLCPEFMWLSTDIYGRDLAKFLFLKTMLYMREMNVVPFMDLPVVAGIYDRSQRNSKPPCTGWSVFMAAQFYGALGQEIRSDVCAYPVLDGFVRLFYGWVIPRLARPEQQWLHQRYKPLRMNWARFRTEEFAKHSLALADMLAEGATREQTTVEFFKRGMGRIAIPKNRKSWTRDPALKFGLKAMVEAQAQLRMEKRDIPALMRAAEFVPRPVGPRPFEEVLAEAGRRPPQSLRGSMRQPIPAFSSTGSTTFTVGNLSATTSTIVGGNG